MPPRWAWGEGSLRPVRQLIEGPPALVVLDPPQRAASVAAPLLDAARRQGIPIIFVTDADAGAGAGVSGHEGSAPLDRLAEYRLRRRRSSAFLGTELHILLGELGVQTLILACGETSVSVHYTFVDAHQHDYFCRVAQDTVAGVSPQAHEAALRAMEYMQTGARRSSGEIIAALAALAAGAGGATAAAATADGEDRS